MSELRACLRSGKLSICPCVRMCKERRMQLEREQLLAARQRRAASSQCEDASRGKQEGIS